MAFYENSNPWSLHNYKDNVLHGAYKTWFENGQLRIEGQYDNGIKIGNWRFFDEKGNVIEEKNFSENPEQ
jgi:antitoxin component YwqK of YwqJK toxin-antitoxin module